MGIGVIQPAGLDLILAPTLTSRLTLGQLRGLSMPQFTHLQNGDNSIVHSKVIVMIKLINT